MKIIKTTDSKYLGQYFPDILISGAEIEFSDGYTFSIENVVYDLDFETIVVSNPNYTITCVLEE